MYKFLKRFFDIILSGFAIIMLLPLLVPAAIALSIWSRLAYRRWRKRFDALPPDEQRKEQERMYKVSEWGS